MHKSRLATIVIDCERQVLDEAARLWSAALWRPTQRLSGPSDDNYRDLAGPPDDVKVLVQIVDHASRVHIDIEADDLEAEVKPGLGEVRLSDAGEERTWEPGSIQLPPKMPRMRVARPVAGTRRWA